jgi:hypothetical protein
MNTSLDEKISFEELHQKHVSLIQRSHADLPQTQMVEDAQSLLHELRSAGRVIIDLDQRQRLESYATYWASFIFNNTGIYPDTVLEPTDVEAVGAVISGTSIRGDVHIHGRLPPAVPFQAPPLPSHFVPRPEVSNNLKVRLLSDEAVTAGVLVVSAIHGLGGIGKSVLAAALAHDPEIQRHFPDGVLWATLGQQPDVLSLLGGWVQNLGDYDFHPATVEATIARLRTLLHNRAALLVIDDVWDPAHAAPFKVGGPHCEMLITTRRANLADELGADLYQLDVMTPEQSLNLISARLGHPLVDAERVQALRLAEVVGYLPLALELASARVRRGASWATLQDALEREIAQLETLEGPYRRRVMRPLLEASFNLSLTTLRAEDEEAWRSFVWLGILPEDVPVTAPMAAVLWETDEAEASEVLELLWNDALLLSIPPVHVEEQNWPAYRLHDLMHDLARRLLTIEQPQGLAFTIPEAHIRLLERYRTRTQGGLWHTLPDDGYIHTHLTWHMERAGWTEEIHNLLREETSEGLNGWYEAQERLGNTESFLKDVARAWRLTDEEFISIQSSMPIGLQCRYALIVASLNSLARNISPALVVALVEKEVWTPAQGLAYARQSPVARQQAEALARLAPHLPEPLLQEALAAAAEVRDEDARALALAELGSHLSEALRRKDLRETLAATWEIKDKDTRAMAGLMPQLPEPLSGDTLREALAAARRIGDEGIQTLTLARLAPYLPEPLLREALVAARDIEGETSRVEALKTLLPRLAELGYPDEALTIAREIEREPTRAEMLVDLAPHLPEPLLWEVFGAARGIEDERNRMNALAALAPHLPEPLLREALSMAQEARDENTRIKTLAGLASYLPEPLREEALQEALAAAQRIRDKETQALTLAGLAPYLPSTLLEEALTAAHEIRGKDTWSLALASLAPYLPEPLVREALAMAQEIKDEDIRPQALAAFAPRLPEPLLREALVAARDIEEETSRVEALKTLLPRLAELGYPDEALTIAREIEREPTRAQVLSGLARHLTELSRQQLYSMWQEMLPFLAIYTRQDLLIDLWALGPVIATLGGGEAIAETFRAIQDVGRWWP